MDTKSFTIMLSLSSTTSHPWVFLNASRADQCLIRLQRIYNLWSIHAILLSVLNVYGVYYTLLYYFWDWPINRRPIPYCCFIAYFSVSNKRNIKRSPNGMKPSKKLFLEQKQSRELGVQVREASRRPRDRGARPPPWVRPPPSWAPQGSPDRLLSPIYSHIP